MLDSLDHIIIAVEDLSIAIENYTKLLGFPPTWRGVHPGQGTENALFPLDNLYVELLASNGEGPGSDMIRSFLELNGEGLSGIALGTSDIEAAKNKLVGMEIDVGNLIAGEGKDEDSRKIRTWKNLFLPFSLTRGIFTFLIQHEEGSLPTHKEKIDSQVNRLDHVVINTNDPEGLISLYRDTYGIRLALDQTVEKWGGRMLFFRLNHTTLEIIGKEDNKEPQDSLWGLAWVVKDIKATYDRLISEDLEVSEVIDGRKPNTLVSTVKSHTCNIPTLLIQHL
ncbi:MAG TPA: glyoxalase-like domain protein [Gammaproteobacteria bacterium]|nr:glyoxalase-like domain protein [Gammaproteobacteria bacterium]